jgi:hypothetical protein
MTTKSPPPISISRTRTTVREHTSVLATRSKQENCPFHLGSMLAAILVIGSHAITSRNLLAPLEAASNRSSKFHKFFLTSYKELVCDLNHVCTRGYAQLPRKLCRRVGIAYDHRRESQHSTRQISRKLLNPLDGC